MRAVLEAQRLRVEAIQKATGQVIPWVFCREDGAQVKSFKKAWATACIRAGFFLRVEPVLDDAGQPRQRKDGTPLTVKKATKLVHDFRRTAVRNLIRAGIPETVAMKLTGHRTRSVFQRYAIVEEGMLREAGERLAAHGILDPPRTTIRRGSRGGAGEKSQKSGPKNRKVAKSGAKSSTVRDMTPVVLVS